VQHAFSQDAVATFASLCGDNNPIHFDAAAAQRYTGVFHDKVVHGLLVSSLFSTLFGRVIHGSIYVRQSLNFKNPVYINDPVVAKMTVVRVDDWKRRGLLVTCSTVCTTSDGLVAIDGEAKVLIPPAATR
jgi:3-hydroxybutyryl-CoA dehydratase